MGSKRFETLARIADAILPETMDSPPPSKIGVVAFFTALFETDRRSEAGALAEFLDRASEATWEEIEEDAWFAEFVEIVHEHYWTSPEGLQVTGFAPSPADSVRPG